MSAGTESVFPRISPDDPLAAAARFTNDLAQEVGLEAALHNLGIHATAGEVAYLGEQRALRAIAAAGGLDWNMGGDPLTDEEMARAIVATPLWRDMRMLLVGVFMDAVAIGWKARELADGPELLSYIATLQVGDDETATYEASFQAEDAEHAREQAEDHAESAGERVVSIRLEGGEA